MSKKGVSQRYIPKFTKGVSAVAVAGFLSIGGTASAEALKETKKEKAAVNVSLAPAPKLETSDGAYQVRLAGFLQFDNAETWASRSDPSDDARVRRARIGVRGVVSSDWKYDLMMELSGGEAELFDANVTYTGIKNAAIRIGQFKEPVGLEWATGCPWWTFMDRALIASLTPKRSVGATATTGGKIWRAIAGYFPRNSTIAKSAEEEGVAVGRFYVAPLRKKDRVLHIGFSANHRTPDQVTRTTRFKAKTQTSAPSPLAVDTGKIEDVDSSVTFASEALAILGPFSVQSEFANSRVNRTGLNNLNFQTFYVQASWFVTGETRAYKFKRGAFGRVKPVDKNIGAVELAARFGTLDLSDRDVRGGIMDRYTLGANWYPNTNIRLTVNYVHSNVDEEAPISEDKSNALNIRAQLAF